jgi:hypothetical protein
MMVRVYSRDVYNVKTITIKSNSQNDIKDKFIGDYSYGLEKKNIDYIKKELKL